jgi:hypothetical protein
MRVLQEQKPAIRALSPSHIEKSLTPKNKSKY